METELGKLFEESRPAFEETYPEFSHKRILSFYDDFYEQYCWMAWCSALKWKEERDNKKPT